MARLNTFALRVTDEEKEQINALGHYFHRSGSDVLRLLVREAYRYMETEPRRVSPWDEREILRDIAAGTLSFLDEAKRGSS